MIFSSTDQRVLEVLLVILINVSQFTSNIILNRFGKSYQRLHKSEWDAGRWTAYTLFLNGINKLL